MANAHYITIGGQAFSPKHPKALAWLHGNAPDASQTHFDAQNGVQPPNTSKRPISRIRQSHKPLLNKLEQLFLDTNLKYRWKLIVPQSMRFKLGNGIWYKPDFIAVPVGLESQDQRLRAYEVKGPHAFRGGFENLKVAAHQYPFIIWTLVWAQGLEWKEQQVLP